jgi:hypothetical protein
MANWTVGANRNLPLDEESSWDGSAAKSSVWEWAGFNGDSPQPDKAKQAFLIYDASIEKQKGAYSLPFARYADGKLTALASGIRAAASRLPQMDGPSDAVKAEARAVIEAYEKKFSSSEKSAPEPVVYPTTAQVRALLTSDDLTAAAKKCYSSPALFESNPPHFFRAVISNGRVDAYDTRMHRSTLENFAEDATRGVSFQNSHNTRELGFGHSLHGEYIGGQNARTEADFYTVPGLKMGQCSTDDLILGLGTGLVRDVSVGFYGGSIRCSICDRDIYSWDCSHWPGHTYNAEGERDPDGELAVGIVHDARLAEVSAVYDGACPGAMVIKARQRAEAGELPGAVARLLEVRYRIKLPGSARAFAGADLKEKPMPDEPTPTEGRAAPEPAVSFGAPQLRALMEAAGLPPAESDEVNFRTLIETVKKLPAIEAERERLAKLADDGKAYRAHLIDQALKEGVRAYGAEQFPSEQYRAQFESAPLDFIRTNLDLWTTMGDAALKGGRQTVDQGEPDPTKSVNGFVTPPANPAHFRA